MEGDDKEEEGFTLPGGLLRGGEDIGARIGGPLAISISISY
jgi:hypothetical protein